MVNITSAWSTVLMLTFLDVVSLSMQEKVLDLRRHMLRNLRGQGHNDCNLFSNGSVAQERIKRRYTHTDIDTYKERAYIHIYKGHTDIRVCINTHIHTFIEQKKTNLVKC